MRLLGPEININMNIYIRFFCGPEININMNHCIRLTWAPKSIYT